MLNAPASRMWPSLSYVYGLLVVMGVGYFLLGIPIQVTDGFTNMMSLQGRTFGTVVSSEFHQRAYLRPMLWAHLYVIYALADGRYFEWFRGWHVFQVLLLVGLFIGLLRPRTLIDAAVVPLGLAVLIGMHTFAGTVIEAYPVNTFMTILLCCLSAAALALGPYRWWRDVSAVVLLTFAALTVESGLLVWVVFMAAYLAGARGVSRGGIVVLSALVVGYLALRFLVLDIGSPGLIERSSGYGFSSLDPEELVALFGDNPVPFYIYNVITSAASVLVSEPRGGVFRLTRSIVEGEVWPYSVVNVVASLLGTALIVRYAWRHRAAWIERRFETPDRLVLIFVAVLGANAAISFPYQKDVIMSPAGVFFALAVAVAARDLMLTTSSRAPSRAVAALVLVTLSVVWSVRAVSIHLALRDNALDVRNEWALIDEWLAEQRPDGITPANAQLKSQLQGDAIVRHPAPPGINPDWYEIFDPQ